MAAGSHVAPAIGLPVGAILADADLTAHWHGWGEGVRAIYAGRAWPARAQPGIGEILNPLKGPCLARPGTSLVTPEPTVVLLAGPPDGSALTPNRTRLLRPHDRRRRPFRAAFHPKNRTCENPKMNKPSLSRAIAATARPLAALLASAALAACGGGSDGGGGGPGDTPGPVPMGGSGAPNLANIAGDLTLYALQWSRSFPFANSGGGGITECTASPELPRGVQVEPSANKATCQIIAVAAAPVARTTYTITATNASGSSMATASIVIVAQPGFSTAPSLASIAEPVALVAGRQVDGRHIVFTNSGGNAITSCRVSPALPAGLRTAIAILDGSTCLIEGVPAVSSAQATYTVIATNAGGGSRATVPISINSPGVDTAPALGSYITRLFVNQQLRTVYLANNGGAGITTCTSSPALPTGMTAEPTPGGITCQIDGASGVVSEPTTYTITGTNPIGSGDGSLSVEVRVQLGAEREPNPISLDSLITLNAGMEISPIVFFNRGGGEIVGCRAVPSLPQGLNSLPTEDNSTCEITGKSTGPAEATVYKIFFTGYDGGDNFGTGEATAFISVLNPPGYSPAPVVPDIERTLVTGKEIDPIILQNSGGGFITGCLATPTPLPAGLFISATEDKTTCQITGTPLAPRTRFPFRLHVGNRFGSIHPAVTLTIVRAPEPFLANIASTQIYSVGDSIQPITFTNNGSFGVTECTVSPGLPMGLTVAPTANANSCEIKGDIDAVGPGLTHTVTATNAGGSGSARVRIAVLTTTGLSQALDTSIPFGTSGDALWTSQTVTSKDGVDAAESSGLSAGQTACFYGHVRPPGRLSLDWKIESGSDSSNIFVRLNADQMGRLGGTVDWAQFSREVPAFPTAGTTLLSVCHHQAGDDASSSAWIDQLGFISRPQNLRATLASVTEASLVWDEFPGATYYRVFRGSTLTATEANEITSGTTQTGASLVDAGLSKDETYHYWVRACDPGFCSGFSLPASVTTRRADEDGDGLIEIRSLSGLNNIRYDLSGARFKLSASDPGITDGCPSGGCQGYELMADLDFDTDADEDTSAWGGTSLDPDDDNNEYFDIHRGGWVPIGDCGPDSDCTTRADNRTFNAIFEGNDHTIRNLASQHDRKFIGMFGALGSSAVVRNLNVLDSLADYLHPATAERDRHNLSLRTDAHGIGILAGYSEGEIRNCGTSGFVHGEISHNELLGGLVGLLRGGRIVASNSSASITGDNGGDTLGGLVGRMDSGSITASYAAGTVNDGGSDESSDAMGALVGRMSGGSITASYALGNIAENSGASDSVGGFVAIMEAGSIAASYAFGYVGGGFGSSDVVGGFISRKRGGSVTASYAVGIVSGGGGGRGGEHDRGGSFIGHDTAGTLTHSWGYGGVGFVEIPGVNGSQTAGMDDRPAADIGITGLTAQNIPSSWSDAAAGVGGAWDYGTVVETPALNYADYDGPGNVFHCEGAPNAPGDAVLVPGCATAPTLIPGQRRPLAPTGLAFTQPSATEASFSWGALYNATSYRLYRSIINDSGSAPEATTEATRPVPTEFADSSYDDDTLGVGTRYFYWVVGCNAGNCSPFSSPVYVDARKADNDGNGLIEIYTNRDLHNVRFSLDGTSYSSYTGDPGNTLGCPEDGCGGYELMADLDLAEGAPLLSISNWLPIGHCGTDTNCQTPLDNRPFRAVFDGRGHTISNLTSLQRAGFSHANLLQRTNTMGLFGLTDWRARILNLGVLNVNLSFVTNLGGFNSHLGGIIGRNEGGLVAACHSSGRIVGSDPSHDSIGGIVGSLIGGTVVASFSSVTGDGRHAQFDTVGGLVGYQFGGTVIASYATGDVSGGQHGSDSAAGLIGRRSAFRGTTTRMAASYATGNAAGGGTEQVFESGFPPGVDRVGALDTIADSQAHLIPTTDSWGFGMATGGRVYSPGTGGSLPTGITTPADFTAENVPGTWNSAAELTLGAWDFGGSTQAPALNYADYDGPAMTDDEGTTTGDRFHCAGAANPPKGAALINCVDGPTLIGHQRVPPQPGGDVAPSLRSLAPPLTLIAQQETALISLLNTGGGELTGCTAMPNLPTGLMAEPSTDKATCQISGTPSTDSARESYTITATNATGSGTGTVSIAVVPELRGSLAAPILQSIEVPVPLIATRLASPFAFINAGGGGLTGCTAMPDLPTGLMVARTPGNTSCQISGTPAAVSGPMAYTITATNATGSDSGTVTISVIPLTGENTEPVIGSLTEELTLIVGQEIPTITLFNGGGGDLTDCAAEPNLPMGLTTAIATNGDTCRITGTPTAATAQATYTITATNAAGTGSGTVNITVAVQEDGNTAPDLSTGATERTFIVQESIATVTFLNTGGGELASCTSSPDLPIGLTLAPTANNSTCQITGIPQAVTARASYIITATNTGGSSMITMTIAIGNALTSPALGNISTPVSLTANQQTPAAITFLNTGGGMLTDCTVSPNLPMGLTPAPTANKATCEITGTPQAAATQTTYTVTATNAAGNGMGTVEITVAAPALAAPSLDDIASPVTLTAGQVATAIAFANSGGASITGCASAPDLPMGLVAEPSADDSTCEITGTPQAAAAQMTYTVTATNATGAGPGGDVEITVAVAAGAALALAPAAPPAAPPAPAPAAPGLEARVVSATELRLSWGAVPGAAGYRLHRSAAGGAWEELTGPGGQAATGYSDAGLEAGAPYRYRVEACGGGSCIGVGAPVEASPRLADADGDGLIEVAGLADLGSIRHDPSGASYRMSAADPGTSAGCPAAGCRGYELVADIDFDRDGDGRSWKLSGGSAALDPGDHDERHFNTREGGWLPIDAGSAAVILEGNGHAISNLASARPLAEVGLFARHGPGSRVRNLGLPGALAMRAGAEPGRGHVGALAGRADADIVASYASGAAIGGAGPDGDDVGGLVGRLDGGSVTAAFADAAAGARGAGGSAVGGLVGRLGAASLAACHARGDVSGGPGPDSAGGLVGIQGPGSRVAASYATGAVDGGGGADMAGSLVGNAANAGPTAAVIDSWGFGAVSNGANGSGGSPGLPADVTAATGLTAANAPASWSAAATPAMGAWDFGGPAQAPALNYADYDGPATAADDGATSGDGYHCAGAASPPAGAALVANCATGPMLIPNQRAAAAPGQ